MASVNITSALNKIGLTRFGGIFLWLILHRQFVERHLNWVERPLSVVAVERHNLTLRWTYMKTLGLVSSFREAEFTDLSSGEKTIAEKVLNTAPIVHTAYRPRFHIPKCGQQYQF
nr:uncharacterized protein LOC131774921 [Pocillopora verrucosa]